MSAASRCSASSICSGEAVENDVRTYGVFVPGRGMNDVPEQHLARFTRGCSDYS